MKRVMILVFAMLLFLVAGCQQNDSTEEESAQSNDDTKYEDYVYQKYDLDVNEKVKIGDATAENSFVLAFDYSCPWCHKWMEEVLPILQEKYLDSGKAYYVGQPIIFYLNKYHRFYLSPLWIIIYAKKSTPSVI